MTHYELSKYAQELGLMVETGVYRNEKYNRSETYISFREHPRGFVGYGRYGINRGDKIAHLVIHDRMDSSEYADACATAHNSLRQYSTWRKY
ncbi:hypothetical protein HOU91_gp27 [Enterobacter phage EcpYZU01]|uniref:hypothetical protein n=1 Tax=Enterobacter phage EcpYZU01 TaxID=2483604 RepID=UPI0018ACBE58|nr:hypothetical protein HOU91_gp27 [Enterobacter phage EcpYZU01]